MVQQALTWQGPSRSTVSRGRGAAAAAEGEGEGWEGACVGAEEGMGGGEGGMSE